MTDRSTEEPGAQAATLSDTTSELWDRIADDLAQRGRICAETVEKLVSDACARSAGARQDPGRNT